MGPIQSIQDLLEMLRRRAWLIVLLAFAGIAATVMFALSQPREYEATAVIQVERLVVMDGLEASASGAAARRLQLIQQRLTSRDNLWWIIGEYGLYADMPALSDIEKVALLRSATQIELTAVLGATDGSVASMSITVRAGQAETAAAVANDLATMVIEEGARTRSGRADAALDLFEREEADLGGQIAALEAELAAFKAANDSLLPESAGVFRMAILNMRTAALDVDRQLSALEREREALAGQEQRARVQRQIPVLDEEIAGLREERALLAERIATAEGEIGGAAEVERAIGAYTLRLDQLRERFRVTTERRAEAELGQRLESDQQAERFELLESAVAPEHPVGPARRKIAAAGGVASIGVAMGIAFLLDLLNPVLRTPGQMQRALDLRPVVTIPLVQTRWERRRQRMLLLGFLLAIAIAGLLAGAVTLA